MNELSHELRDTIHIASSEVWQLWACHKPYHVLIFLKSYLLLQGREARAMFHSACVESGRERGVNVLLLLLYGFWESNSHPKAWMAITLPLSHLSGPTMCFYSRKKYSVKILICNLKILKCTYYFSFMGRLLFLFTGEIFASMSILYKHMKWPLHVSYTVPRSLNYSRRTLDLGMTMGIFWPTLGFCRWESQSKDILEIWSKTHSN